MTNPAVWTLRRAIRRRGVRGRWFCDYRSCEYTDIDGYEANTSSVDGYNVVVELAQTHLEGVLEGMHTYRVYIETFFRGCRYK